MLAHLVKANSPPSMVPAISIGVGRVSSHTPEIIDKFKEYYEHLFSSWQGEIGKEVDAFFRGLTIPALSETEREGLDSPITLEELQRKGDSRPEISRTRQPFRWRPQDDTGSCYYPSCWGS